MVSQNSEDSIKLEGPRLRQTELVYAIRETILRAGRSLRRTPTSTVAAMLALALGIGANSAVLSLLHRILFQGPPGVAQAGHLFRLRNEVQVRGRSASTSSVFSYPALSSLRAARAPLVASGYSPVDVSVSTHAAMVRTRAELVASNYFAVVGAVLRNGIVPWNPSGDGRVNGADQVVISARLAHVLFGESRDIIGEALTVAGQPFRVAGVAAPGFGGLEAHSADLWLPLTAAPQQLGITQWARNEASAWLHIIVRPTSDIGATRLLPVIRAILRRTISGAETPGGSDVIPALINVTAAAATDLEREVHVSQMLAVVSLSILIAACVNAMSILLARATANAHDTAVRRALGASGWRLFAEPIAECLELTFGAASLAVLVAVSLNHLFQHLLFPDIAYASDPLRHLPLGFVGISSAVVGGSLGWFLVTSPKPSILAINLSAGNQVGRARGRLRDGVVGIQLALTMALLVLAGAFIQSLRNVEALDIGIDLSKVLAVEIPYHPESETPAGVQAAYSLALRRLVSVPLVESATLVEKSVPLRFANGIRVVLPGALQAPMSHPGAGPYYSAIDDQFFSTLGSEFISGRGITQQDIESHGRVMVVNRTMARRFWPQGIPSAACATIGNDSECTPVVGVVEDIIKFKLLDAQQPAMLYIPLTHPFMLRSPEVPSAILVRTADPKKLSPTVLYRQLRGAGIERALSVTSLASVVEPEIRPWRRASALLIAFGVLGLVVCAVGLYGLLSYVVARRTREIGLRIALGAENSDIIGDISAYAGRLYGIGIVAGSLVGLAATTLSSSMLFGISSFNLGPYLGSAGILSIVVVCGIAMPAWRAVRIDPARALRSE